MNTYHIHINGVVQGVGFRPAIYRMAKALNLAGKVKNSGDGLHIYFNAGEECAEIFFRQVKAGAPLNALIISSSLSKMADRDFTDFSIAVNEDESSAKIVLLPPDKKPCDACIEELFDSKNRRSRYPFITCIQCGPRYSIIDELPYERHHTAMKTFQMCSDCLEEYNDIADRRFFSQTNSCASCGIRLSLYENKKRSEIQGSEKILSLVNSFLRAGKIVAVKGVGGYLLLCDAANAGTIQQLRQRKQRPAKPFAVLYPSFENVAADFPMNEKERKLLESEEAPIVLLYPKEEANGVVYFSDIAPGLNRVGVMLPSSPLLALIAADLGKPLIATSANISGSPIIYKDEEAVEYLFDFADLLLSYDRGITCPQDDSVVQVTKNTGTKIMLRRSRGYAPSLPGYSPQKQQAIFSAGAMMKSSFTLSVNGNVFVSQFLGSGQNFESQKMYSESATHLTNLYDARPAVVSSDLHPGYFSHSYAKEVGKRSGAKLKLIQHHEAHFAAALAEANLLDFGEPVLGIIWDGTGLGTDGNIWGGEFFRYNDKEMLRSYHFDYFPSVLSDKTAEEPRIAALCACTDTWPFPGMLKEKFTEAEWHNYRALIGNAKLFTSSVGRIFDAVASLLGLCDRQSYEGEAAMYVQGLAERYVKENGFTMTRSYFSDDAHYYRIPTASLMQGIVQDIQKGKPKDFIAAKFHYSLVMLCGIVSRNVNVKEICFSGGVFQNSLLVDWLQIALGEKFNLHFHQKLSPNDENISFGQFVYADNNLRTIEKMPKTGTMLAGNENIFINA